MVCQLDTNLGTLGKRDSQLIVSIRLAPGHDCGDSPACWEWCHLGQGGPGLCKKHAGRTGCKEQPVGCTPQRPLHQLLPALSFPQ